MNSALLNLWRSTELNLGLISCRNSFTSLTHSLRSASEYLLNLSISEFPVAHGLFLFSFLQAMIRAAAASWEAGKRSRQASRRQVDSRKCERCRVSLDDLDYSLFDDKLLIRRKRRRKE